MLMYEGLAYPSRSGCSRREDGAEDGAAVAVSIPCAPLPGPGGAGVAQGSDPAQRRVRSKQGLEGVLSNQDDVETAAV